jgi:hypothetical protein
LTGSYSAQDVLGIHHPITYTEYDGDDPRVFSGCGSEQLDIVAASAGDAGGYTWSRGDGGNPLSWEQPANVSISRTATCDSQYYDRERDIFCDLQWTEAVEGTAQISVSLNFDFWSGGFSTGTLGNNWAPFSATYTITSDPCGRAATTTDPYRLRHVPLGTGPDWSTFLARAPMTFSREYADLFGSESATATFSSAPLHCPAVPPVIVWLWPTSQPPCGSEWEPLVAEALKRYKDALSTQPPEVLGYYYQVLNITCAAARSPIPECAQMVPYYDNSGWSEDWVFDVFNGYLTQPDPGEDPTWRARIAEAAGPVFKEMADQCANPSPLRFLVPFGPWTSLAQYACPTIAGDLGTMGAGAPHFANELDPWFKSVTRTRLTGKTPDQAVSAACAIRQQHEALFRLAVAPGFDQVSAAGYMTAAGRQLSQEVVPRWAALSRDRNLIEILDELYGSTTGDRIYKNYVATCGDGGALDNLPNTDPSDLIDLLPGSGLPIGFSPGTFLADSLISFVFTSDAVGAGSTTAAANGSAQAVITVPNLQPGAHVLHIHGLNAAGEPAGAKLDVTIAPKPKPPTPKPPTPKPPTPKPPAETASGYWLLEGDGDITAFGGAKTYGSVKPALAPGAAAVALTTRPDGKGLWVLTSDGDIVARGAASDFGRVDLAQLTKPDERVATMSATPTGKGLWVFTTAGRILSFGNALPADKMAGSAQILALNLDGPIIHSAATPSGKGAYLVASDGGVFTVGDARFVDSVRGQLTKLFGPPGLPDLPVVGITPDPDGDGYWMVAADGGVFSFRTPFRGSLPAIVPFKDLAAPVNGMVPYGNGYLLVAGDGGVFTFSDKPFQGSGAGNLDSPVVGIASA